MGLAPCMGVSMTMPTLNVRPSLLSTAPAIVPLRPPVTSSSESTKGAKCPCVAILVWDEIATSTLLKHYKDRWSHVNKGNLRPKNWEEVTLQLNNEVTGTFTPKQGTQVGDGYNDGEDEGEGEIGGATGGKGGDEGETIVEEIASVASAADAGDATRIPQVQDLPGVKAQKVKEPKRTLLGSITKVLGEGIKGMAQTMKDYEKERTTQEERLLKLRMDEEAQQMEIYIKVPIQADQAFGCMLWRLAHGHSTRTLCQLFGMGDSTIRKYTNLIIRALTTHEMLVRTHLETPSGRRLAKIIEDFQNITNLLNMCGAVDGTHIKLAGKPQGDFFPAQYVSRHGFHISLLQGIVDSRKIFWNVVCSAPGDTHNSTVFKGSTLYAQMKRNKVLNTPLLEVSGLRVRPYIVGDSAYKPMSFLLKAYKSKGGQDLSQKNVFDRHIAKGRVKVENAFGILKNRWRILRDLNVNLPLASLFISACCVWHNFVQLKGEPEPLEQINSHPNVEETLK
ncbi:hypothetical protein L7F22_024606 [Adiantum nelumboides]|nr:hypothetical protein [Adiantum nelumboides]